MIQGHQRTLARYVEDDLKEKMVFIGGPRQVGKTTLALSFLKPPSKEHPAYLNYDIAAHQKRIRAHEFPEGQPLIVLDEIHKYARWRTLVKGFYDLYFPRKNLIVTGSARLDHYRKGGDSLVGRYHYHRLHPFSVDEFSAHPTSGDVETLLTYGGFPEPLTKQNSVFLRRWRVERNSRVLREDLRDLETVKEVSLLEALLDAIPDRVGSPFSIRSLQEDLQVAHETISRWLVILENVYLTYRVAPFGASKIRAIKKEQKIYLWDWTMIDSPGARFENMTASLLLKFCHFQEDTLGHRMELRYLRDRDGREVDFVVIRDKKPLFAVECKLYDTALSPHIVYFAERTNIPKFYQVHRGNVDVSKLDGRARVLPFEALSKEITAN